MQTGGNNSTPPEIVLVRIVANRVKWGAKGAKSAGNIHEAESQCGGRESGKRLVGCSKTGIEEMKTWLRIMKEEALLEGASFS